MQEYIYQRKSIRKYQPTKLTGEVLGKIEKKVTELVPLFSDIEQRIVISNQVNGLFKIQAPQYFLFYSQKKAGYLENIGYLGQHLSLYLNSLNLGSCWLGAASSKESYSGLEFVICMAFGEPAEPLFRSLQEFKRKAINKISNVDNELIRAAALAPSAFNAQDWYFYQINNEIHCYHQQPGLLLEKVLGPTMCGIDLGIAMCHLSLLIGDFSVVQQAEHPEIPGCQYFRTLKF